MTEGQQSHHGSFFRRMRPVLAPKSTLANENSGADAHYSDPTSPSAATADESGLSTRQVSSLSSVNELQPTLTRRSASVRSPATRGPYWQHGHAFSHSLNKRSLSGIGHRQRSSEGVNNIHPKISPVSPPIEPLIKGRPTRGFSDPQGSSSEKSLRSPNTANNSTSQGRDGSNRSVTTGHLLAIGSSQNARVVFQHIQDLASKRISTLDYLRKAHEGDVYWLTAFQFQKSDLNKMPYFEARKLARRATNYLILGLSIPAILDPNSDTAIEYLRAFHALLTEFESYQSIHSPEGHSSGSLGRARIPQMFKRATHGSGPKNRRTSSSTGDPLSPPNLHDLLDNRQASGSQNSASSSAQLSSFPAPDQDLLPGEEYTFLLTPFLPFDPDYYETFATLCDVLIDCYTKVMELVNSPETCGPGIGDLFSKADAKVRKILIAGLVQDFEESTKQGIKSELAGVGKVVLGGLL